MNVVTDFLHSLSQLPWFLGIPIGTGIFLILVVIALALLGLSVLILMKIGDWFL